MGEATKSKWPDLHISRLRGMLGVCIQFEMSVVAAGISSLQVQQNLEIQDLQTINSNSNSNFAASGRRIFVWDLLPTKNEHATR